MKDEIERPRLLFYCMEHEIELNYALCVRLFMLAVVSANCFLADCWHRPRPSSQSWLYAPLRRYAAAGRSRSRHSSDESLSC